MLYGDSSQDAILRLKGLLFLIDVYQTSKPTYTMK